MHKSGFAGGWTIGCACAVIISTGCSPGSKFPVGTVTGRVTYHGQPVPEGTLVQFHSTLGPTTAVVRPDGTYEAQRVRVGQYVVTVTPPIPTAADPQAAMEAYLQARKAGQDPDAAAKILPVKYQRPNTSGITFDLKAGANPFDLELKD